MTQFSEKKALPYSCQQLFDLVANVESYPDFLPWIQSAQVSEKQNHGDHDSFVAEVTVGYKFMTYPYKCRVRLYPVHRICIDYMDGPFESLKNEWTFHPLTEKLTKLSFFMEFHLKTGVMQALLQPLLNDVVRQMTSAFDKRAQTLY